MTSTQSLHTVKGAGNMTEHVKEQGHVEMDTMELGARSAKRRTDRSLETAGICSSTRQQKYLGGGQETREGTRTNER